MISQYWLDAIKQQGITWTSVDQDHRHHMTSLGHNELNNLESFSSKLFFYLKSIQKAANISYETVLDNKYWVRIVGADGLLF